jgi:hypothetical protein
MKTRRPSAPQRMIIKLPALDQEPPQSGVRLSVAHAAERADVSTRTIKRWIEKAYLPAAETLPRRARVICAFASAISRHCSRAARFDDQFVSLCLDFVGGLGTCHHAIVAH